MSFDNPEYVLIASTEDENAECEEFQLESDGTLLLSTLRVQYVNASGLKYRNPETGSWRTLKIIGDRIYAPTDSNGWFNRTFIVALPKDDTRKRPFPNEANGDSGKIRRNDGDGSDNSPLVDLIILGLSYDDRDEQVLDFFSKFGEVTNCEVKMSKEGTSRGFAFLRFKDRLIQRQVLLGSPYKISGRDVNVRRADIKVRDPDSCRLFVTKLQEDTPPEELKSYFSKFGEITDIFIPKKNFRNFGFITFAAADSVNEALDDNTSHTLDNGNVVMISRATPRKQPGGQPYSPRGQAPQSVRGGRVGGGRQMPVNTNYNTGPSLLNQNRAQGSTYQGYQNPNTGVSSQQEQIIYQAVKMALSAQNQGASPQPNPNLQMPSQELPTMGYCGGKSSMGVAMPQNTYEYQSNPSHYDIPRYDGYDDRRGRRNRY